MTLKFCHITVTVTVTVTIIKPNKKYSNENSRVKTLPGATQPIGKIHPFRKIPVMFEPMNVFYIL